MTEKIIFITLFADNELPGSRKKKQTENETYQLNIESDDIKYRVGINPTKSLLLLLPFALFNYN